MARERKARRFDPFFPITAASMEAEAEHLRREVDSNSVLAPADVEKIRVERHANCENTWRHLCLVIGAMPERDQRVLQAMMFRDLWFVLELYKTYLQPICRTLPPVQTRKPATTPALPFSEWLFDPS